MNNIISPEIPELTIDKFRDWLSKLPCNAIVGQSNESCDCPLATYLKQQPSLINADVMVTKHAAIISYEVNVNYSYSGKVELISELPEWAEWFVEYIDRIEGDITALTAFGVLEKSIKA